MWTGRTDNCRTCRTWGTSIRLTSLFVLDAIFCHFNILKCSFMFFSVYLVDLLMIHLIHALDEFCNIYLGPLNFKIGQSKLGRICPILSGETRRIPPRNPAG